MSPRPPKKLATAPLSPAGQAFDERRRAATVTLPESPGGKAFEDLQKARTELRHMAHVYVGTKKKDKFFWDRAAEDLEKAAVTVTLAASLQGMWSDCARPAGAAGRAWHEGLDPENALAAAGVVIDKHIDKWNDDTIQFPRLLCELVATCDDLRIKQVAESMDLSIEEVNELFERAHTAWEKVKLRR